MDGVHDLGGIEGFGPVAAPPAEPVFHDDWERRATNPEWTARDLLIHLANSEPGLLTRMQRILAGTSQMPPDFDLHRWNLRQVEKRRAQGAPTVESLVAALDETAAQARRTVRVVTLQNANSSVVQQTLGSLMSKVKTGTIGGGSRWRHSRRCSGWARHAPRRRTGKFAAPEICRSFDRNMWWFAETTG